MFVVEDVPRAGDGEITLDMVVVNASNRMGFHGALHHHYLTSRRKLTQFSRQTTVGFPFKRDVLAYERKCPGSPLCGYRVTGVQDDPCTPVTRNVSYLDSLVGHTAGGFVHFRSMMNCDG